MAPIRSAIFALGLATLWPLTTCDHVWPNEQNDELESILYEQSTGIRTITLETLQSVGALQTSRSSVPDLFALAAILAREACYNGNVIVPMRPGRTDAAGPGPSGVPQPQEDLASHTESFKRQGFNVTEMISLVACGHTIAGVHDADFHEIVPVHNDSKVHDDSTVGFDTTTEFFENTVAKEFVANISQNSLAFGDNVTTRSNFRIFKAERGETINSMAESNDFFLSTCTVLFERMLNTVSRGVILGDIIEPILVESTFLGVELNTDLGPGNLVQDSWLEWSA